MPNYSTVNDFSLFYLFILRWLGNRIEKERHSLKE